MVVHRLLFLLLFIANIHGMDVPKNTNESIQELFSSIKEYKYEETGRLLKADPSLLDRTFPYHEVGMTPLHIAAYVGNCQATEMIIAIKPSLIHSCTQSKKTPLHIVKNKKVAKILLKNGAVVDAKDDRRETPLSHFLFDKYKYNYDIEACLVKYGANVNAMYSDYFQERLLHRAVRKNLGMGPAKFLLKNGANPELMDINKKTPFDQARINERKTELFKKVGIYILNIQRAEDNPFELLKENASYFKQLTQKINLQLEERKTAERAVVKLFLRCKKQELNPHDYSKNSTLKAPKNDSRFKQYILKYVTLSDVEKLVGKEGIEYAQHYFKALCRTSIEKVGNVWSIESIISHYPIVFYYDTQTAFLLLKYMIENEKNLFNNLIEVDITGIDEHDNSLLHYAVLCNNAHAIEWLIKHKVDCSIKNKENKTAIDYIQENNNEGCQTSFFYTFHDRFFGKKLTKQNEKLIVTKDFCNVIYLFENDQPLFFKVLDTRPDKILFFLKRGTYLNYKDKNGISPLASMIQKWHKTSWEKIPKDTKYLIRLLLEYNAVVEKKIIEPVADDYLKKLLQKTYDNQECCVCFEHPEELSNIPCINKHVELLCKICYTGLYQQQCPLCRTQLDEFYC